VGRLLIDNKVSIQPFGLERDRLLIGFRGKCLNLRLFATNSDVTLRRFDLGVVFTSGHRQIASLFGPPVPVVARPRVVQRPVVVHVVVEWCQHMLLRVATFCFWFERREMELLFFSNPLDDSLAGHSLEHFDELLLADMQEGYFLEHIDHRAVLGTVPFADKGHRLICRIVIACNYLLGLSKKPAIVEFTLFQHLEHLFPFWQLGNTLSNV